jgi:hypothetical protein
MKKTKFNAGELLNVKYPQTEISVDSRLIVTFKYKGGSMWWDLHILKFCWDSE